jgi:ABC-2 type transport system permease protein
VEVLWLGILLVFYRTVFTKTSVVVDWSEAEYLFFVGCYFTVEGLVETFFLTNCSEFSDLIRSGDLDFVLLKPIDEQFLVSCRNLDWSTAPNALMGMGVMGLALYDLGWVATPANLARAGVFVLLVASSLGLAYSFLLMLTSTSVWFVRNQSLMELWWLFSSLMRYPREIFTSTWAAPIGTFFTFVVPVMLVVNVPARIMVKALDDAWLVAFTLLATAALAIVSRWFFRLALRRYRSASS